MADDHSDDAARARLDIPSRLAGNADAILASASLPNAESPRIPAPPNISPSTAPPMPAPPRPLRRVQRTPSNSSIASAAGLEDDLSLVRLTSPHSDGRLHRSGSLRVVRPATHSDPQQQPPEATAAAAHPQASSMPLAVPLADFQSDDVLNAPNHIVRPALEAIPSTTMTAAATVPFPQTAPIKPAHRPAESSPAAPSAAEAPYAIDVGDDEMDDDEDIVVGNAATGGAHHQQSGGRVAQIPIHGAFPTNPFLGGAAQQYTRDQWSERKVALITGITGQDGSYLAELLLSKGYTVHGIIRRSSSFNTSRLYHLFSDPRVERDGKLALHYGDLTDSTALVHIISQVLPSEVYNLGAQSHVKVSFDMAEYTADVDGVGTLRLLDAIRTCGLTKLVKFYQASTSEMYGQVRSWPQDEDTPFHPRSPYGVAKVYGFWITVNYRESYDMFTANGILFNHESPRRGRTFVTRKISRAVAEISLGRQECMYMGNLDARRDWGHARDYVEGMWRMLQHDKPDDFVLATNETHSVRSFIDLAFKVVGRTITWHGSGVDEQGVDDLGRVVVRVDERYFRPAEVDRLLGNPAKATRLLGWKPTVPFEELVREMVMADIESAKYLVEDLN